MKSVLALHDHRFESLQRSPRNGQRVVRLQLHHGATTNAVWMRDAMVSGSKQVSANSICTNDGALWLIVDGKWRAFTSADADYDRGSWTVETANLSTNGWTISNASHETLAQLAAALCVENGWGRLNRSGPFSTWNVVGHREIFQFLGRSYATACPGGLDLDRVVQRGNAILALGDRPAPLDPITETEISAFIASLEENEMSTLVHFINAKNGKPTPDQFIAQVSVVGGVTALGDGVSLDVARRLTGQDKAPIPVYNNEEESMVRNMVKEQTDAFDKRMRALFSPAQG